MAGTRRTGRFGTRGVVLAAVCAAVVAFAAGCCCPKPACCPPRTICCPAPAAPGAPPPVRAAEDPVPPGGKFVKIKIINKTKNWTVKKDVTLYRFEYDTDDLEPYCDAVSPSGDQPFPEDVAAGAQSSDVPPEPYNRWACSNGTYGFQIDLVLERNDGTGTQKSITAQCDKSGFKGAGVALSENDSDPDDVTATCQCQ